MSIRCCYLLTFVLMLALLGAWQKCKGEPDFSEHGNELVLALIDVESRLLNERANTLREIDILNVKICAARKRLDELERKLNVVRSNLTHCN